MNVNQRHVAIVTGSSRGIGRITALCLARAGYAVVINYHASLRLCVSHLMMSMLARLKYAGLAAFHALPVPIQRRVRSLVRTPKRVRLHWRRVSHHGQVDRDRLAADLRSLGVQAGDTIFVHSALSSLGYVDGGANTVVEALLDAVEPNGTMAVPTFTFYPPAPGDYLDPQQYVFDPRTTPSTLGKITEVLRLRPDAVRSEHPTHSVAAVGRHKRFLTEAHVTSEYPYGRSSPFYRLVEVDGKIVCIGVPIAFVSFYHVLEDITSGFPIPVYFDEPARLLVRGDDGTVRTVVTRVHNPEVHKHRIEKNPRVLTRVEATLQEAGVLVTGMVGNAYASIMRARALLETLTVMLRDGSTIYARPDERII